MQDRGLVDADAVDQALAEVGAQETPPDDLDGQAIEHIVASGACTHLQIIQALAEEFNMETIDLNDIRVSHEALELVDRDMAARYHVFPIEVDGNTLELATCDPLDVDSIDSLSHVLKMSVNTRLTTPESISKAIENYYDSPEAQGMSGMDNLYRDVLEDADIKVELPTGDEGDSDEESAPIIRYVHMIITEAIKRRGSDIHMEPLEKRFRVRYRIDGRLQEVENPPKRLQPAIISRIKLMANVSIAEKRVPQDGRIQMKAQGKEIDLRVSVLPTVYGESIVMRILDKEGLNLGLPQLGFFSDDQANFEKIIAMPDGVFLVTGPTGSGKSTTLYSALNYVNHPDRKIITVEDPVEYQMTGINQVQVRKDVGMTFAAALRSMLRQAPNIIMVGEIRDLVTAEIAINASLTGHMVFSTLHTNDAPSSVTRLVDIGVKPFLVSAALRGALAQRLVRRICLGCKKPYLPEISELNALGVPQAQLADIEFFKGEGCAKCTNTGCKGRMGIFEFFVITEEVQQMIYEGRSLVELRSKAREAGMRTMREDGFRKVAAGMTTIEEVLHVTVGDMS
ncbi:type IV fimbrial assembly protein PilB [Cerasicoccus arenae]|uniref:Type IV fimbrial assembly protein PilB n=2 Tax=Cerasicoccus arenae TaxID=424488 RepID=A0A8J3D8W5_9BACT|nr:ATPase, T2SS/T4P/T4SS family [Cerasicoccus arenae]GHB90456.1 type IV fimbrial assembly protein PilB [Cerasicoccus arenae]